MGGVRRFLLFICLGVVSLLLATAMVSTPVVWQVFVVLGLGFFLAALATFARDLWLRSRDPYDLRELKRIHEEEELRRLELPDADELEQVVCPNCGWVYSSRFPICPECRTSPRR